MGGKISETRFTIQFSKTDPSHLHVAEILNGLGRRSKAPYLVNAVLYYENRGEIPQMPHATELDIKVIEAVVNRILQDRQENGTDKPASAVQEEQKKKMPKSAEEISFDDALEALGPEGFNAVAGTLDMFRKK